MDNKKGIKKIIILIGCLIMAFATTCTFVDISGWEIDEVIKFTEITKFVNNSISGEFVLIAAVISALFVCFNKEKLSLISTVTALVITFIDYFEVKHWINEGVYHYSTRVYYLAPWIVLVGAIIALAPIVIGILKDISKKKQQRKD